MKGNSYNMGEETTITIGLIIAVIGGLGILYSLIDKVKSKSESRGKEEGVINTKLDTIITNLGQLSEKITKLELSNNNNSNEIANLKERVIRLEKIAHKPNTRAKEKSDIEE